MIRRGDIYWVDFHGAVGAEIRKVRPAVVVSEQDHNDHMRTVTVVPLSSGAAAAPDEVSIPADVLGDGRPSRLKTHQIRAVDKSRLGRRFGVLPQILMPRLVSSLREHFGME